MSTVQFTQTWHKHDGGPCPVADTATVMVSYKSGLLDWACQANTFRWINGGGPDSRSVVAAYTTDIFDGNFDHIPDAGEKVDWRDIHIDAIPMSTRSHNCLKYNNLENGKWMGQKVETVGQLFDLEKHKLLRMPNLGRKSMNELGLCVSMFVSRFLENGGDAESAFSYALDAYKSPPTYAAFCAAKVILNNHGLGHWYIWEQARFRLPPQPTCDAGEKVLTGKAGDTFRLNRSGEFERYEPTRGAGCENTPEWLYETINQQKSAK